VDRNYARYSFWLATAGDDLTPRPPLDGSIEVDVAILGAGFSGLWTAYYLLRRQPSLRVALIEAEIAGYGASGRNGGWCSASFPYSVTKLARRYGREGALALVRAMRDTVDEVGGSRRPKGWRSTTSRAARCSWPAATTNSLHWRRRSAPRRISGSPTIMCGSTRARPRSGSA